MNYAAISHNLKKLAVRAIARAIHLDWTKKEMGKKN